MSFGKRYLFALFIAIPAFAQESGGPGSEKPSLLIWQALNFFILAGLIGWLIAKYGGPLLTARSKTISEGLAAGTRAKAEADARAAEVQKKLSNLEQEIAILRSTAQEERARETERIKRETQAEIVRIQFQANVEIESAGKQARLDVQRAAAALAIQLAEQKVIARMSPDVQSSLLQSFLKDLTAGPARSATAD